MRRLHSKPFMPIFLLFLLTGFSAACHRTDEPHKALSSETTPDTRPSDTESTLAQLKRYKGQTRFLNIDPPVYLPVGTAAQEAMDAQGAGESREIQESDLFKVGVPGSKLLYLLNPYRGLQVLDFSAGPEQPRLLGRTDATGNEVLEMTFDAPHLQIIVQERLWNASGQTQGRLVVYDVSRPESPRIKQTLDLPGEIADTRQVGQVLYVASSQWQSYQTVGGEGRIQAFQLTAEGLLEVSSYTLALPVASAGSLQIVESETESGFSYHLIATLSQNRWNWWDRQSTVEVVDISDPKGSIHPVLLVSTQGQLRERSGTMLHKGSLVTVSNSWTNQADGTSVRRVTVESFVLPKNEITKVSQLEADLRRLWFERELQKKPEGVSLENYTAQLQSDPVWGMKGIFVEGADGRLIKPLADQAVTVGDSTGLHADLQDVRFVGDRLYVFWVPANQIDPLDIFDISQPESGLPYLGRTFFEGWMERGIPFRYQNTDYILGLGWIVPVVGEDTARRPQAMIFKISDDGKNVSTVAQLSLQSIDLWTNFNDQDKFIDVRFTDEGAGTLIFPASSWGENPSSGGKILSFDLSRKTVLEEHGFLASDTGWLRRVFNNPEIDRVHTLSDRSLSTFDVRPEDLGAPSAFFGAVSILELARDIRAFAVPNTARPWAIQIIDQASADYRMSKGQLRLLPPTSVDGEAPAALATAELPGQYESHVSLENGDLLVLSSRFAPAEGANVYYGPKIWTLSRVRIEASETDAPQLVLSTVEWQWPEGAGSSPLAWSYVPQRAELHLSGSLAWVIRGEQLATVDLAQNLALRPFVDSLGCAGSSRQRGQILVLDQRLFANYSIPVVSTEPETQDLRLSRSYLAPVDTASQLAICEKAIEIPGRPLALQDDFLMTDDLKFMGFESPLDPSTDYPVMIEAVPDRLGRPVEPAPVSRWPFTVPVLSGLQLNGMQASLLDLHSFRNQQHLKLESGELLLLEQADAWSPRVLTQLRLSGDGFSSDSNLLPLEGQSWASLIDRFNFGGETYLLVQVDGKGRIYKVGRLGLEKVSVTVTTALEGQTVRQDFPLSHWIDPNERSLRIVRSEKDRTLTIAQGLWGVVQIKI